MVAEHRSARPQRDPAARASRMMALRLHVRRQVLVATWVGLVGGAVIGVLLGGLLESLENAPLLFNGAAARFSVPLLLAAVCASVSVALLLPLSLLVAGAQTIWASWRGLRARRLYWCALAGGTVFLLGTFWVTFRLVRDVTAPRSIAMLVGFATLALAIIFLPQWPRGGRRPAPESIPGTGLVCGGLVTAVLLGLVSYLTVAAPSGTDAAPTNTGTAEASSGAWGVDGHASAPDVILVSIDTLRADHLSVNGYERRTSPYLDQVATDGVDFVNARSQAPWTLPSHAAMLVGRYPSSCGVRFAHNFRFLDIGVADRLASADVTLAEILHAAGFRTAAFTSTEYLTPRFGFDQGFEQMEKVDPRPADHSATVIDKGIAWLAADTSRPAFLFLHLYGVHQYSSPSPYDTLYQDPDYQGQLKVLPRLAVAANLYESLTDADLQYLKAKYDGALRYVDDQLGRLFAWLRAQGRYDHTLLVITADHGEEFWEHGGTAHGFTLYDEQLRVPLLIKPPAGFAVHARRPPALAGVIDVAPTILDYIGLPRHPLMHGTTLRPAIEAGAPLDRTLFAEATFFFNSYAIIRPDYKYIDNRIPPLEPLNVGLVLANVRSFFRFRESELYQIERDPQERANLAPARPAIVAGMRQDLLDHIRAGRAGDSIVLDAATTEHLRALGYAH